MKLKTPTKKRPGDKHTRFKSHADKPLISTDQATATMVLEERIYFVDEHGRYVASFHQDGIKVHMPAAPAGEQDAILSFEDFTALHRETRWQPVLLRRKKR